MPDIPTLIEYDKAKIVKYIMGDDRLEIINSGNNNESGQYIRIKAPDIHLKQKEAMPEISNETKGEMLEVNHNI